jgi:hypothetical protein
MDQTPHEQKNVNRSLLRKPRKTVAESSAPPEGPLSSSIVWRRASAPFALLRGSHMRGTVFAIAFLATAGFASADTIVIYNLSGTGTSHFGPGTLTGTPGTLAAMPGTLTGTMNVDLTSGTLNTIDFVANGLGSFASLVSELPPVSGLTVVNSAPGQVTVDMSGGFIAGQLVDLEAFFGFSGTPDPFLSDLSGTYTGSFSTTIGTSRITATGDLVISASPEPSLGWLTGLIVALVMLTGTASRRFRSPIRF